MQKMVMRVLEQEPAIRQILSADQKTSHLVPSWQDVEVLSRVRTDNPGRIRVEIKPDLPGLNSVSACLHLTWIDTSRVHAAVQGSVYSTSTRAS